MRTFKLTSVALLVAGAMFAQGGPLVNSSKAVYGIAKNDVMRSAEKVPENLWSYRPTPEVRTMGELFAHVADSQYEFCGAAASQRPPDKNIEKTVKRKADIIAALKEAYAYCDGVFAKMTDADAAQTVKFGGQSMAKLAVMDFNTAHTNEHYGNLVTYMRLNHIVPPSSEQQGQ